ncbi:exo-1,4-beta-xylosidase xlnD [Xylogone sp. PMI_703]|nr:exo-1,4-beta-xylosidase xlnD [Xylogone sp. PMI_703]
MIDMKYYLLPNSYRRYFVGPIVRQCFCDTIPDFSSTTKTHDSRCNSACATDQSRSCGGTYVMSLCQILNSQGYETNTAFIPACQTQFLCSHQVCYTSLSIAARVSSPVNSLTVEEKILNLIDASAGSTHLGLPSYEWWNEATHGVGSATGVQFTTKPANFSYATSFPEPILIAASFDGTLIRQIPGVVGKESRAFGNNGFSGFDFWAPNINAFRDLRYVRNFILGLQGEDPEEKQMIATCKHFAVYDLETGRYRNGYNPSQQDLADYFPAPFKTCVRDTGVGSIMCSYNAVDGILASDYNYIGFDCGAVTDIWQYHNFTDNEESAASVALNAGTTVHTLDRALTRLYSALFTTGFFDGEKYSDLDFSDVGTPEAQLSRITLIKNSKLLPLGSSHKYRSVAVIGPFANATTQVQGDYSGTAQLLVSPLEAFEGYEWKVSNALGTEINNQSTFGFRSALAAAGRCDLIIYPGGIDNSIEAETLDRVSLTWPGNQLDLITSLSKLSKPMVVRIQALIWAGYPGQSGGTALLDILPGKRSVAGRPPVTQYPANYADQKILDHGYNIQQLVASCKKKSAGPITDSTSVATIKARVKKVGHEISDYVGMLFLSSHNAGQTPRPNKSLVAYMRLHNITTESHRVLDLPLTLGSLARAHENGNLAIFPGEHKIELDISGSLTFKCVLHGNPVVIDTLPVPDAHYNFTVPVHIEPASTGSHHNLAQISSIS